MHSIYAPNNSQASPATSLNRRAFIQTTLTAAALGTSGALTGCLAPEQFPRNAIQEENAKPGTRDWLLTKTQVDPNAKCRCPWIEGYCSHTSIKAGESLAIMVSTNPVSSFLLDIYRLGYYGGTGGRHLVHLGPFKGVTQPDPLQGPERVQECRWTPSVELQIPGDWLSGVYLGKLTAQPSGIQSYVIFIVRDDRPADFLFQCSDTTWAAYNRWPQYFSLYDDAHTGESGWYVGPQVRVSWDRPYGKYRQILDAPLSQGSGEFLLWEFPLAYWMEQHGYDLTYISNADTHSNPGTLLRGKTFLSVGHDEYWSLAMFNHVKAAVAAGVNAAFLCGNSCDGLLEFHPSAGSRPGRSFSRIGKFGIDDPDIAKFGDKWKMHGPDPATLMGARSTYPYNGTAHWTCIKENHWLFEGTGLKNGDSIPGLVGWEHHGEPANIPGLEILARGPVFSGGKPQGVEYTATIYPAPKGNLVFNAATIWWALGLSAPPGFILPSSHGGGPLGPDHRVQQITKNLFNRLKS